MFCYRDFTPMLVSILGTHLKTVSPRKTPAVVLIFERGDKSIAVLGYPQLEGEVEEFVAIFEELSGFKFDGITTDWDEHNRRIIEQQQNNEFDYSEYVHSFD